MSDHHKYGFSKWPALSKCGCYESDDKETDASKSGTKKHEDLSECLNELATGVPALHESDEARWASKFIYDLANGAEIHNEDRVEVPDISIPAAGIYGTCDIWFTDNDDSLYVIDFKSGAESEIDYRSQVEGYAYALMMRDDLFDSIKTIQCYVLYGGSRKFYSWTTDITKLRELATRIEDNIKSATTDNPVTCVNGMCQYCKHKTECKKMNEVMVKIKDDSITNMSDAKLYELCSCVKAAAERALDDLKARAVENGGFLDDGTTRYEIRTNARGKMTSVDVPSLWYDMSSRGCSITQDQLMKVCTVSKEAFKELYKTDAKSHGMLVKDVEETYVSRCQYGAPASRMVKVEK